MNNKFSKDFIAKAKFLYEHGVSLPKIAKRLGLKRHMTIYNWAVKFGWKRNASSDQDSMSQPTFVSNLDKALLLGQNTIDHLSLQLSTGQITTSEAIKIIEKLPNFIRFLKAQAAQFEPKPDLPPPPSPVPPSDVLQLLDSFSDERS